MFKYHKKNKKTGNRTHLQKSLLNYSPFDMRDTSYLEHLHKELKLRNAREAMISLRNDLRRSDERANDPNDEKYLKWLEDKLHRPNMPHPTKEHQENALQKMLKPFKQLYTR